MFTKTTATKTRIIVVTIAALTLALSISVGKAAAAGSTTKPDIYGCFAYSNGYPSSVSVSLDIWNGTKFVGSGRAQIPNSAGCVRFNDLAVGRYYRLSSYQWICAPNGSGGIFWAETGWIGPTQANDYLYRVSERTSPTLVQQYPCY